MLQTTIYHSVAKNVAFLISNCISNYHSLGTKIFVLNSDFGSLKFLIQNKKHGNICMIRDDLIRAMHMKREKITKEKISFIYLVLYSALKEY